MYQYTSSASSTLNHHIKMLFMPSLHIKLTIVMTKPVFVFAVLLTLMLYITRVRGTVAYEFRFSNSVVALQALIRFAISYVFILNT